LSASGTATKVHSPSRASGRAQYISAAARGNLNAIA